MTKQNNNQVTEIIFLLDRSGSMSGLEGDTIGGYNSFINAQKNKGIDARLTTMLFDDKIQYVHESAEISTVKPLTSDDYYVRGSTALLDAVGTAIVRTKQCIKEERASKVIMVITTDGMENASREYNHNQIKAQIEELKKQGWEFIFMGANIDAVSVAAGMGISADHAVRFANTSQGVCANFKAMEEVVDCVMCNKEISADWKQTIEQTYKQSCAHEKEDATEDLEDCIDIHFIKSEDTKF